MLHPCSSRSRIKKLKEKEKENRNDLNILPSHDSHGVTLLLWNDIELSWKLHLPEHLFWIFTYKDGNVVTF